MNGLLNLGHHGLNTFEQVAVVLVLVVAFIALGYAWILRGIVMKKDKGTPKMQEVWNAIRVGADSYLARQLKSILPTIVVLTVALFFSVFVVKPSEQASLEFPNNTVWIIAIGRSIAFIVGATFSLLVGQLGMRMAIQANVRASSAARRSLNESLSIAYYAGTVTGMLTDGLGLLGGTVIFIIFGKASPDALLGFGLGGTLIALFIHVGGGWDGLVDVGLWSARWTLGEWREFLAATEFERESEAIRHSTHSGRPLGSADFVKRLETALARPLAARLGGRPKKKEAFRELASSLLAAM